MKKITGIMTGVFIMAILMIACNDASQKNYKSPIKTKIMKGFNGNIEKETLDNENFREVVYTGKHIQLVLMSLNAGEEIGSEMHADTDQFFRFETGTGKCIIDENSYEVADGDAILVPAGATHNVINTGEAPLKLYTVYGPPNHADGTIRATKQAAESEKEKFDGKTTE